MAEAALRRELKRKKLTGISVRSAGLHVEEGSTLSPNSAQALKEAKIPVLKSFRPKQLTEKMVKESLLVVCMTERHREKLSRYPNVTSFYELCGREIPDLTGSISTPTASRSGASASASRASSKSSKGK